MPLVKHEILPEYELGIWEATETIPDLERELIPHLNENTNYFKFTNERRRKEWLATRHLLKAMLGHFPTIIYSTEGKPSITNIQLNISISHSENMVAVMISKFNNVGIDIENSARSIDKIAARFLSEFELNMIEKSDSKLTIMQLWCAKEAIFKLMNEQNVEFKDQIKIISFQNFETHSTFNAEFVNNEQTTYIELKSFNFNRFTIVSTYL